MPFKDTSSWSEFDWEREIRKDDSRISAYIAELPKYIDLPGEDSILMRSIKRRLGSEKDDEDWGPVPYDESGENQEDFPFPNSENWKSEPGGPVYHNCSVLARDFAMGASAGDHEAVRGRVMRILTLYGQLMARSADLIDMSLEIQTAAMEGEPCDVPQNLRIAVVKRLLAYQNKLTEELRLIAAADPSLKPHTEAHLEASGMMHDYLVDLLGHLREDPSRNDLLSP